MSRKKKRQIIFLRKGFYSIQFTSLKLFKRPNFSLFFFFLSSEFTCGNLILFSGLVRHGEEPVLSLAAAACTVAAATRYTRASVTLLNFPLGTPKTSHYMPQLRRASTTQLSTSPLRFFFFKSIYSKTFLNFFLFFIILF